MLYADIQGPCATVHPEYLDGVPSIAGTKVHARVTGADVVGQGVFQDISLDGTFSPKEVVVDRLSGTINGGTFAAVVVGSQRRTADPRGPVPTVGVIHGD